MTASPATNPLALVTGGSAGIGLELARLLAKDGHDLVITGSSDRVNAAAEDLRQSGVQVTPVRSDLATEDGTNAVIDAITDTGRPLDIAVFNAGIAIGGAFVDIPLQDHLRLIALNILSPVRMAHALIPGMARNGGGRILLVSSLSATTPTPYESVYGPSKAFLTSFGHSIREELSGTGVQITILHPGATATDFHARAGMGATEFGDNSWKNDPARVARQGYAALMAGETSLIGGDAATQEAGREHKRLSEEEKARRHAKMARQRRRPVSRPRHRHPGRCFAGARGGAAETDALARHPGHDLRPRASRTPAGPAGGGEPRRRGSGSAPVPRWPRARIRGQAAAPRDRPGAGR